MTAPHTNERLCFLYIVGIFICPSDILRHILRFHIYDPVLIAVLNGFIIIPALVPDHIQRLVQSVYLAFNDFLLLEKKRFSLGICIAALHAPLHEFFYVLDLQTGLFKTFDHLERFYFFFSEFYDSRFSYNSGEKPLLVIVSQGGDRNTEHFCYLSYIVHKHSPGIVP